MHCSRLGCSAVWFGRSWRQIRQVAEVHWYRSFIPWRHILHTAVGTSSVMPYCVFCFPFTVVSYYFLHFLLKLISLFPPWRFSSRVLFLPPSLSFDCPRWSLSFAPSPTFFICLILCYLRLLPNLICLLRSLFLPLFTLRVQWIPPLYLYVASWFPPSV